MESARPCYSIDSFSSAVCPALPRSEEVVYALNAPDAGVGDASGLELLQPFQTHVSATRDFLAIRWGARLQQFKGSIEKRGSHDAIIGNILPISQQVGHYRPEALYLRRSLAYENMQKNDGDNPLAVLAKNVHDIKKVEKGLSNAKVAALAARAGHETDIAKTVSNIERQEHGVGINNVVTVADALEVETWQLFLPGVPKGNPHSPNERTELDWLVRTFLSLEHDSRRTLLADVQLLVLREQLQGSDKFDGVPAVSAISKSRRR